MSRYVHPLAMLKEIVVYATGETTTPETQLAALRAAGHQPGCACGHPKQPGCVQLRRMVSWRLGYVAGELDGR